MLHEMTWPVGIWGYFYSWLEGSFWKRITCWISVGSIISYLFLLRNLFSLWIWEWNCLKYLIQCLCSHAYSGWFISQKIMWRYLRIDGDAGKSFLHPNFLNKILQTPTASEPHQILPSPALTSTFHLFPVLQIHRDHHCLPLSFASTTGTGWVSAGPITLAAASSTLPSIAQDYLSLQGLDL